MAIEHKAPTDKQAFYALIGHCITEWASIEECLFNLCRLALKSGDRQTAIVYYRTPALEARLKLTEELIISVLPQRKRQNGGHDHLLVIKWNKVVEEIRELLPVRNLLAHSPVTQVIETVGRAGRTAHTAPVIEPRSYRKIFVAPNELLRGRKPKVAAIEDSELSNHINKIRAARQKLYDFHQEVFSSPPLESSPQ